MATPRYNERDAVFPAVAVVSISRGSQSGSLGRDVCLLWCD